MPSHFKRFFEVSGDLFMLWHEWAFLTNEEAWKLFVSSNPLEAITADDRAQFQSALDHVNNTGEPVIDLELRLLARDGTTRHVEWRAVREVSAGEVGDVICSFWVGRDVTDTRRSLSGARLAAAKLDETQENLLRMIESLRAVGHMAGHDLVEPVRSIATYSKMILETEGHKLTEKSAIRLAKYVVAPANRLRCMLDDLRSYLRDIQEDHEPSRQDRVDLNESLAQAIEALNGTVHEAAASIKSAELPVVRGNALQLAGVFQNLLSNACKYRDASRGLVVNVSAEVGEGETQISVRDNGTGFEPGFREEIFNLGRRLHAADSPKWGSGIGLAQVKHHVERHGGRVWAHSIPGEGTVFHFTLPSYEDTSNC